MPTEAQSRIDARLRGIVQLDADLYITGACIGVDQLVAETLAAIDPGTPQLVIVPADRSLVDLEWLRRFSMRGGIDVREMPPGTSYADRNDEIVMNSHLLYGFPLYPKQDHRSRRSGSWMTIRKAERRGVRTSTLTLVP